MATAVCEPIRVDEAYTLSEFMRRTGLKEGAMKEARKRGLRVTYTSTRAFVKGADWLRYLDSQATDGQGTSDA